MKERIHNLFSAIDNKDADKFISFLTEDARFTFGNAAPVSTRNNIRDSVSGFFSGIKALQHDINSYWHKEDMLICKGKVTYTRLDNTKLALAFTNIFRMKNELISDYRIYIDISELFAR